LPTARAEILAVFKGSATTAASFTTRAAYRGCTVAAQSKHLMFDLIVERYERVSSVNLT
jgi:hypothetical protein